MAADGTRVALVTGGGSGIGLAVVRRLARDGWLVVAAGRDAGRLAAVREELGDSVLAVAADVTDPEAVQRLFAVVRGGPGRLDLLFNNAGTFGPSAAVERVALDDWRATLDVNVTGAFLCAQAAFRLMREQRRPGGRILNNGSVAALVPRPNGVAYTVAKHALTGLTRALALEGRAFGIACGQIDIGNAADAATEHAFSALLQADGRRAAEPFMDTAAVADVVAAIAALPTDANVASIAVMATGMPFAGRG